jgi:dipeptidyl aminopeptidase/acylaminoacyl peptidase
MPDTNMELNTRSNRENGKQVLPFGTWPSSLSAKDVAAQSRRLAEPQLCGNTIYWLEARPQEKGHVQIVAQNSSGKVSDVLPEGFSARSRAHEYGGGSYLVAPDAIFFVNNEDQRVYRLATATDDAAPIALTAPGPLRFADLQYDAARQRLLAVCEDHSEGHSAAANYLVAIPLDGSQNLTVLAQGADFYSSPRLSPDGNRLSWLSWNHPAMPWDATQLFIASLDADGLPQSPRSVAGANNDESIFQPQWSPSGALYFVSDRTNWWNIFRLSAAALNEPIPTAEAVTDLEGEFATPQWVFNMSTYSFLNEETVLATYTQEGRWHLVAIDVNEKSLSRVEAPLTQFSALHCANGKGVLLGASPTQGIEIYLYQAGKLEAVTQSPPAIAPEDASQPRSISFGTTNAGQAHAFFYPPANREYTGPEDEKPPVIVICHGGPTGATETSLNLKIQYWTNRGFSVLDVNYRGSTGYGRRYRRELYGNWGVRDVDDVCAAAAYVTDKGWVHPGQRIIKGSSAGGFTVLAALTFRDTFNAGVSLYGIGDLELLAQDTHKFEARYLDSLIGPYPEDKVRYQALSPINHVEQLDCPLLVFQGLEDKVVPPNQAESMVNAVAARHIPVAYVTYPNEAHGFRQAESIHHMLTAEQEFYQRIFKLGRSTTNILDVQNLESNL